MRREKEYLKECLEKAGIKNEVITTWKRLQLKTDSHVGAVLREGQTITRDGSKRNYEDQNGVRRRPARPSSWRSWRCWDKESAWMETMWTLNWERWSGSIRRTAS